MNFEMKTENWDLVTVKWELRTGNCEITLEGGRGEEGRGAIKIGQKGECITPYGPLFLKIVN